MKNTHPNFIPFTKTRNRLKTKSQHLCAVYYVCVCVYKKKANIMIIIRPNRLVFLPSSAAQFIAAETDGWKYKRQKKKPKLRC